MKRFILIAACFLIFFQTRGQQQFKWVTGGGTNEDLSSYPLATEETQFMCTDANGNVYALSQVGDNAIYADTFVRLSGAYGNEQNILLTSYNCNGQMRWAKLIGGVWGGCVPYGVSADNLGHIYMAAYLTNEPLYIGYDTVISGLGDEDEGVMQFDTAGHFNWVQYVGDNTTATFNGAYSFGSVLTIDNNNNAHFFNYTKHGVAITPTETSVTGIYEMVYNTSGTLLSSAHIDLDSEWYFTSAVIDPVTNKLYVSGQNNQGLFGGIVTDSFFAAAFDTGRHLLWQYFCNDDGAIGGVTLDQSKHLHFSGNTGLGTFSFNGMTVTNTHYHGYASSILLTTDTNGHPEWIKKLDGDLAINGFYSLTQLPNNKVAAVGTFVGEITDGTNSLVTAPGYGYSPFIAIVDSEGSLLTLQQAYGDGTYNEGGTITSDNVGNLYFGGYVADSIFGGTIPAYHSVGGNTDFFVMKYGVDCSCTSAPMAAFTDTGTHHTIGVTYTGTTSGIDSVVWSFGDGTTTTGTSATHTYTDTGTYNVCVTVYTECGVDERCGNYVYRIDSVRTLVGTITSANIRVYPNPANNELNVMGLTENTSYRLLSVTGITIQAGMLQASSSSISLQGVVPGIYVLEMIGSDGGKNIVRVVKY